MVDYKTDVHTIYLSGAVQASPKLSLNGTVMFNLAKAEMDQVYFPVADIDARTTDDRIDPTESVLHHMNFDFSEMHDYSNLDYEMIRFGLGMQYQITPTITFTADGDYADLTDNEGYVYGDESGSYFMIRSGLRLQF